MKNKKLEFALNYAQKFWSIIPVGVGEKKKAPYLETWAEYQKELPNEELLNHWWTIWPEADPAVITGAISGLVVLDIDVKNGNKRSPDEFSLPKTVCSKTRSGGWHYFFKHPGYPIKNFNGALFGPGVDLKADGGYVVLPPASNEFGEYEWINNPDDCEVAELPNWLLEKINNFKNKDFQLPEAMSRVEEKIVPDIPVGTRNNYFTRMTGKLLNHFGPDDKDIRDLIFLANNGNSNPLPPTEMATTYNSIAKLEITKRSEILTSIKKLKFISAEELGKREFPPLKWAVQDIFEINSLNMLSSPSGKYKTWLTLDLAICLASGRSWFGKFEVAQQGVLIINEEDPDRRFQERLNIMDASGQWQKLPIYFSYRGLNHFKFTAKTVESVISLARECGAKFIIFDALKSITISKENDSDEMQEVMDCFKRLLDEGLTLLIIHHHRKGATYYKKGDGEDIRGSSAIIAALDGHIVCEPTKDKSEIAIEQFKSKGGQMIEKFAVKNNLGFKGLADEVFPYIGPVKNNGSLAQDKNKEKILSILTSSDDKWLSLNDFTELKAGGSESLRDTLKEMVIADKTLIAKFWVEIEKEDLPVINKGGAYNTKFYHLANEGVNNEGPP